MKSIEELYEFIPELIDQVKYDNNKVLIFNDKATRFCSRECEKKFWKRPHWEHKDNAMQNAPGWKLRLREQSCD